MESLLNTLHHYSSFAVWGALIFAMFQFLGTLSQNRTGQSGQKRYWPSILIILAATFIAWGPFIITACRNYGPDPRQVADEKKAAVVEKLSGVLDPRKHFRLACTSGEACSIAKSYQSLLADAGWKPEAPCQLSSIGVYIETFNETDRPLGVAELESAIKYQGHVNIGWLNADGRADCPPLTKGEFWLVIGEKQ